MITWYQGFILTVIALRLLSAPGDRAALSIILVASLVSTLLVHFVTHEITGAWKLAFPGAIEVMTIMAMMEFTPNRTGFLQSMCLLVAWMTHALCYFDIAQNTDIVYSRYETILLLVAIAQILVCYDTLARCGRIGAALFDPARFSRVRSLRLAGVCNSALHGKTHSILQEVHGSKTDH